MHYIDTQRTLTRRESSLITPQSFRSNDRDYDALSPAAPPCYSVPFTESGTSIKRPKGSVQKELVTMMFESMLNSIVESWEVIQPQSETITSTQLEKSPSELTSINRKRKSISGKVHKPSVRRSKVESTDTSQVESTQKIWWSSPDERAIVRFRNGNVYEGSISMKCMNGQGRFQWADGTVYLGSFEDNTITGKGIIQWKDDSWYEGDFVGNVRHGKGLYVDSRRQRSYAGDWHCGTKHGQGVIYYNHTFKNSYDGDWEYNVRQGYGTREYSQESGYKGDWDKYFREGNGLMIWPNHDFYSGEWKNGVMSGYGIYIWNTYFNNSLSLPSICAYRGNWLKGQRSGYGVLNLGFGTGAYYKGEFKNDKKHGAGRFVSNNGLILQNKNLFTEDNFGSMSSEDDVCYLQDNKSISTKEPYTFNICDNTVGLIYHVIEAIKLIDKQTEVRKNSINSYIENNKSIETDLFNALRNEGRNSSININFSELIDFEESALRKSVRCYETDLRSIYYKYATVCNTEEIQFTPILIRLFLWQFYYDCDMHKKGITLVDIDDIFHRNSEWLSKSAHNPFEKIYFWQFRHSLISVASKLYAKRELPGPKPDTILASGFRTFMERDVLPNVGRRKGHLVGAYGQFVPLKGLYSLYRSLGEAHTVRDFLCAVRSASYDLDNLQPPIVEALDNCLSLGRNAFVIGDDVTFIADEGVTYAENEKHLLEGLHKNLRLFNFGNLSSKAIIQVFANIFPQICCANKVTRLDIDMTFYEFFEAFIVCAVESIRIKDEEVQCQDKFSTYTSSAVLNRDHPQKHK